MNEKIKQKQQELFNLSSQIEEKKSELLQLRDKINNSEKLTKAKKDIISLLEELAKISKGKHETIKNSVLKKYLTVTYIEKQQEFSIKIQDRPNDQKLIALPNLPYSKNTEFYNILNDVNKNILQKVRNLPKNNKNFKQDKS